jgi:hypothetical protein
MYALAAQKVIASQNEVFRDANAWQVQTSVLQTHPELGDMQN